ncbi:S8 family serine peptidase [Chryseobacterium sp. JJR-5R]|uniref:S8 family peptidase n=1 Tax=Chryseobacterium sp. JJR-5R TaxID=3093923 RepID=UPI002A75558D|nr:S8 family serine peptidase [Chryseobacterium sp. JJR-5R]WPO81178.1 S8 family serine peptidase [Chryseobacterium sp. JJR-5R]
MKSKILPLVLLAGFFSYAQNKLYYVQVSNESSAPKITDINGKIAIMHSDERITRVFSKYDVHTFEKAFPTTRTPYLQNIYLLEAGKEGIAEELKNYAGYFPLVEETFRPGLLYIPNDYNFPSGSSNPIKSLELINVKEAWDYTHGDPNFKIGISDTPIRTTHEDLSGKVTSLTTTSMVPDFHGTAVSSQAAANTDNNRGIPGTGFNSSILFKYMNDGSLMNTLLVLSQNGARVVNASWYNSCSYSAIDQLVIDEIHDNGTVIIVAAGNGGTCGGPDNYVYPASYNNVISVSTVGYFDVGYTYNNIPYSWQDRVEEIIGNPNTTHQHNDMVDLRAPGINVLGALADSDSSYGGAWGTSIAAPQIAGVVALLFSVNSCLNPDEVETILKLTSANLDNIPENQPYVGKLGAGRIDAGKATKIAWQMNPANGGEVLIKDRSFSKWDFELTNSAEFIRIQNESFTQNANVRFKAKKSITLDTNTVLEPGTGSSHYLYIDDTNSCYAFSPRPGKSEDLAKKTAKITEVTRDDITLYPIPAKDNLFVKTNKELKNSTVKIFDMSNRLVFEKTMSINNTASIDISLLLKGVYFIDITDSNSKSHYAKKFIKQ